MLYSDLYQRRKAGNEMNHDMERFICPECRRKHESKKKYFLCEECKSMIEHPKSDSDDYLNEYVTLKTCPRCGGKSWHYKSLNRHIVKGVYHCNVSTSNSTYCPKCKKRSTVRHSPSNVVEILGNKYIKCSCGRTLRQDQCDYCGKMFDLRRGI